MDPQQRWALEAAYHAFENGETPPPDKIRDETTACSAANVCCSGIATESLRSSRTAVFSATFADDFTRMMAKDPDAAPLQAAMGTTPSIPQPHQLVLQPPRPKHAYRHGLLGEYGCNGFGLSVHQDRQRYRCMLTVLQSISDCLA